MNSRELVKRTIQGKEVGRTPVYGWVRANLQEELTREFGSVEKFEDEYEFDMAHIFGGPSPLNLDAIKEVKKQGIEITPEILLDIPLNPVDNMDTYGSAISAIKYYGEERSRFCYVQTSSFFETYNEAFGIEDHLCYLALYPDELKQVYQRQVEWTKKYVDHMIEIGVDMIHISDDWGAQNSLMFSKDMWQDLMYPYHKQVADYVKKKDTLISLHSDGHIMPVLDGIVDIGFDVIHPWQESSGMDYKVYLEKYEDKFGILGGLCVQTTLGFGNYRKVEEEIRRVFKLLKGHRWMFCTTHFVQDHCSIEELLFAYDLATQLARNEI